MIKRPASRLQTFWLLVLGSIITATGVFFTYFGIRLTSLGGSSYFLVSGIALLVSGFLLWRGRITGAYLYGVILLGTILWALWDVGLDFWPLVSRLLTLTGIAILIALSLPLLQNCSGNKPSTRTAKITSGTLVVAFASAVVGMFFPHETVPFSGKRLPLVAVEKGKEQHDWRHYGNTSGASRFVALDQITRDNVKELQVAWTYHTGDIPQSPAGGGAEDQLTPLQVGNRLFLCTPHNNIIALDATSGKQLWKTEIDAHQKKWMRCRGMAYFDVTEPLNQPVEPGSTPVQAVSLPTDEGCERRIIMNSVTPELVAVDADTGDFCQGFGEHGRVNLSEHMGKGSDNGQYYPTSAPTLAGTTVVVGGRVADNVSLDMPGGVVRGFDVITGKLRWAFDPGNPREKLEPVSNQTYTRSTPNVWAPMSYDPKSNTVFMPTGSPAIDLWGVKRSKLDREFGASMVAIDASTGKVKWTYQTVHNDLWDFDVPMQPSFVDFPGKNGIKIPALAFGTKAGQIFILDRSTGKPLTKVEEKKVDQGKIPDEMYSPTQPVSTGMPQIGADILKESDMWGATPFDQLLCRIHFKSKRYNGLFTPPGHDASLNLPGSLGGMNWGGFSTDPVNNYLFINDMRVGLEVQLVPTSPDNRGKIGDGNEAASIVRPVPLVGTPYSVNAKVRFMSPIEIPCQKPPFGTLSAVDLKTQQIVWQVPVGTVRDTGPFGMKMGLLIPIGMPTIGGTLATQGGLVFIAATQDYYLRAYDSSTGKEIWRSRLPVGSQGTPISYKSSVDGKQYLVISAGGARNSPDRGDYVIAYRLP